MYIKNVVIDGFKSYGKRTEIAGFDQLFNAITGLNGSGKSNILDAICFALGLTNMSLARCTTLRELIFKNGQAGVNKAVVTVTFDNSDKSASPTGYDHLNEIVIRREVHLNSRTKYYVCGQSATNSQVSDLFHSCQLNISNPHFLIMQGRITKVLNMKPKDILGMIEEATGVSMYNDKKIFTQNTIEKKESHLKSIDNLINETILPKLEQLRSEHAVLLDYQNLVSELEKLSKQYTAWQFTQYQQKADHASEMTDDCNNKIKLFKDDIGQLELKQEEISQRIVAIERHNDELSGGRIAELEEELKEEERIEIKETGRLEKLTDSLNEERKKKKDVEKLLAKDDQLKQKKQQEYDNIRQDFDKIEQEYISANAAHERAQKNYEAVTAGKALNEDGDVATSLADQLIKAEEEYNSASTEMKIAKTKLMNFKRDLNEKRSEATKHKAQYDEDNKHIASLEENVNNIKTRLDALDYDDGQYGNLQQEMCATQERLKELSHQLGNEEASVRLNFEYSPIPGFNPSCVRGPICNLFTLKDPKYARAVEAAAGGRLYDIAIDTNDQCKEILDKGHLKRRHNLIALNKVQGRPIDRHTVDAAKKIANDKDVIAIMDLIDYEPHLKSAMQYVFGDTLVAPNVDKAMKITYSNLRKRTVTLDGDIIMPGGDMSGGAVSRQESFLVTLIKLRAKLDEKAQLERRYHELKAKLASTEELRQRYLSLDAEFKHHSSKLDVVRNRLQLTSTHHKLFETVKQLEIDVAELEQKLVELQEVSNRSSNRAKELKTKLNDKEKSHKRELEAAERALAQAKKETDAKKKLIDQRKGKVESLRLEIEDLTKSCEQYCETINRLATVIEEKQNDVNQQMEVVEQVKGHVKKAADKLKEQKEKLREQNEEINKLSKKRDRMGAEINEKRLEIKKIQHQVEQINSEAKDASHAVKTMLRKYDWIAEERHLFGKDNSDYPFNRKDFNIDELTNQVQKLTSAKNALSKTVNQRANMLLSDKEKEAEQLSQRRNLIEQDKDKLIKYMEEVDRKKKDALHKAWLKINVDFNGIFSTFLPNTHAKLELVPGKDILYGLEVKVAFGDVWKESLTELSGGQRSLVALSLVLALLKYNPAPLYILDEVDAALDQNHTQNTGTMIKKHFNRSQFIIVSLKDDMFRNANVLFKTKFVDGKSEVTRYTHSNAK
uniref:Structural maintenance of chromosomes protein n=2 Tax=Aceria tosichella TaxID=561515 RepID=A0A6G1S834_9ACAR